MFLFINCLSLCKKTTRIRQPLSRHAMQTGNCGDNSTGVSCNNHVADFMSPRNPHATTASNLPV